jgi:hypothetical protein
MVYTDGVHVACSSLDELHLFMAKAGIKRCHFHRHRKHPHYDKPKRYDLVELLKFSGITLVPAREVLYHANLARKSANAKTR